MPEIEVMQSTAERFEKVREEWTGEFAPPPDDDLVMRGLLDTLEEYRKNNRTEEVVGGSHH